MKRIEASRRESSLRVMRDLLCGVVESEDASVQVGRHDAGANRRDDAFMQGA
jgi:hypothetical protein